MANTVTIGGKHIPKWGVYAGVGVVVVGGILYFKRKGGSSSSSAGTSGSATDPVTGLPYSEDNQIDPATGLTYLGEAQQYGSVAAAEAAVGAGYGGVSNASAGYSGLGYGGSYSGSSGGTYQTAQGSAETYATNSEWASAVIAALPSVTGDSSSDVASAVANYLAGLPLSTTQANDIQVALAEFGPPPTGSFSIIAAGSGSGSTGSGGTPQSYPPVTTPPPTSSGSGRLPAITGLSEPIKGPTGVRFTWNAVPGATGYVCLLKKGGANGTDVNGPFVVTSPVCNFGGLKSKTAYTAFIWPSDATDPGGTGSNQPHAQYSFTTT